MPKLPDIILRDEKYARICFNNYDLYCEYHQSENKDFILAVCDYDPKQRVGGYRKSGCGHFFVSKNGQTVMMGELQRPNDGKIGNNGSFVINDWLWGDNTNSVAYCISITGEVLLKEKLGANLLNNGISDSSRFAIFITANSNNKDCDIAILFDTAQKKIINKIKFGFETPESFTLIDEKEIWLHYSGRPGVVLDWSFRHIRYLDNGR
ncbi:hypothetical protein [Longitalea arenae]|uniref:hypothetical protein n=1 Tax=Longitalea arenae TaxID=2812558 RepID=UPI0019674C1D|nr:hypothetical protein [Longitalea arenae]